MHGSPAFLSAILAAEAIRNGDVSALELLEAQLGQIRKHNPALNAIVTLDEAGARERAKEADAALRRGEQCGPLHGVPITIKDLFEVAGMRSTCSSPSLAGHVPARDAVAVARLRAAGAIILGKTNLPQEADDFQTASPIFGRTNNPWDPSRTPGGSSGGGGAAVAGGLSFLDLGSDLAGSIRVPAHFCGVYGFAPTFNLVPRSGWLPKPPACDITAQFSRIGPLARSVADLRLCLTVIAGPDDSDPEIAPLALPPAPMGPLGELAVAWTADGGVAVTADTQAAISAFAEALAREGCRVEQACPPGFDFELARQLHGQFLLNVRLGGRFVGKVSAFDLDMKRYLEAERQRHALIVALEGFLTKWDAWLCPVTAMPAFEHREPIRRMGTTAIYPPIQVGDRQVDYLVANAGWTMPFNLTGNPVVVMPVGRSGDGLPIGIQVVGRRWRDMELLSVAEQLALVSGPLQHPPGYGSADSALAGCGGSCCHQAGGEGPGCHDDGKGRPDDCQPGRGLGHCAGDQLGPRASAQGA